MHEAGLTVILLYSTLLYSPLLSSHLLCSTLLYSTLLYSTLLYSTLLHLINPISSKRMTDPIQQSWKATNKYNTLTTSREVQTTLKHFTVGWPISQNIGYTITETGFDIFRMHLMINIMFFHVFLPSEGWAGEGVHWAYVWLMEESLVTIAHRGVYI